MTKQIRTIETSVVAVISTAHITEQAAKTLADWAWEEASRADGSGVHHIWDREEGIMVYTGLDDAANADDVGSVSACIDFVLGLEQFAHSPVEFILFDRDADTVEGLATYDW